MDSYYKAELLDAGAKATDYVYVDYIKYGDEWEPGEFEAEEPDYDSYEDYLIDNNKSVWDAVEDLNNTPATHINDHCIAHYFDEGSDMALVVIASAKPLDDKQLKDLHRGESSEFSDGYGCPYPFNVDEFDTHAFQAFDMERISDFLSQLKHPQADKTDKRKPVKADNDDESLAFDDDEARDIPFEAPEPEPHMKQDEIYHTINACLDKLYDKGYIQHFDEIQAKLFEVADTKLRERQVNATVFCDIFGELYEQVAYDDTQTELSMCYLELTLMVANSVVNN